MPGIELGKSVCTRQFVVCPFGDKAPMTLSRDTQIYLNLNLQLLKITTHLKISKKAASKK